MHSSRRHFLATNALGIGSLALAWLLEQDGLLAQERPDLERRTYDLNPRPPHFPPRARAMISLFMQGGPSHMDLLDPKPELDRLNGKPFPGQIKYDNAAQASSKVLASPWKFKKHGRSGIEVSELLPHLASIIDDVCVVRSMQTSVNNHVQSIHALNTGRNIAGQPVLGSWLTYGLGSVARNLPAFVALTDPVSPPVAGTDFAAGRAWASPACTSACTRSAGGCRSSPRRAEPRSGLSSRSRTTGPNDNFVS